MRLILGVFLIFGFACTPQLVKRADLGDLKETSFPRSYHKTKVLAANKAFHCVGTSTVTVLVIAPEGQVFNDDFCNSHHAQMLLHKSTLSVVGLNHVDQDFGGEASLSELKTSLSFLNSIKLSGVWATGVHTIAASRLAKEQPDLQWLVLGEGVFDTELLKESQLNAQAQKAIAKEGRSDFDQLRSTAWEIDGLPPKIFLYHAQQNSKIPYRQSLEFRDVLTSQQIAVEFVPLENSDENYTVGILRTVLATRLRAFLK
jgi:hypothetical protein